MKTLLPYPAPQDRYSLHANRKEIPEHVLKQACLRAGMANGRLRQLSGGFQNSNFLVEVSPRRQVLRFYTEGRKTAEKERDLLKFLSGRDIKVPVVLDAFEVESYPIVVLEYLEGIPMQELRDTPGSLYHDLGVELGKIHNTQLPRAGFIGPGMKIGSEYEEFARFLKSYMEESIGRIPEHRLSPLMRDRWLNLINDKWKDAVQTEPRRELVHCDFNPKNIMVSSNGLNLIGVIDWEFGLSGNGLIDIGNFFRFETDYPPMAKEGFIQGYRAVRGEFPKDWLDVAKLFDLGNMCSFLERKEDYPKTFNTARIVVQNTLAHFGY